MAATKAMMSRTAVALWVSLVLLSTTVRATYWTVTSYYMVTSSVSEVYPGYSRTYESVLTVASGASPTLSATSTTQSVRTYEELTIVYLYLPEHAVPDSEIQTTRTFDSGDHYTVWVEPTVYTAPASCPTPFTVQTTTWIDIPTEVTHLYTPTSASSSTHGTFTYVTAYLKTNEISLPVASTANIYTNYLRECINPTAGAAAATQTSSSSSSSGQRSGGGDNDDDDDDLIVCSLATGCVGYRTWVIVVATLIPCIFVLGFVESYFWFRRLMLGKGALRFGTVCWVLISLWVLCFTRAQAARGSQAQALMRQRWAITPGRRRWSLWWKWGFRHAYPVDMLGDPRLDLPAGAPKVVGQETAQMQQPQGGPEPTSRDASGLPAYQPRQGNPPDQGYQPGG